MKYLLVINNSMVVSGCMENAAPLFTPITPRTQPMLFDSVEEATKFAKLAGEESARVWTEEDYALGKGVADQWPKSGEVRERIKREVCINPHAEYAGGSGALWAVEGEKAQLTLIDYPMGYIKGECEKIAEDGTFIRFHIINGALWGDYEIGKTIDIPIGKIRRYDQFFYDPPESFQRKIIREHLGKTLPDMSKATVETMFRDAIGGELAEAMVECAKAYNRCLDEFFGQHGLKQFRGGRKQKFTTAKKRLASSFVEASKKVGATNGINY
jgi:hypothetical protein